MKPTVEFNINQMMLVTSPRAGEEGTSRRLIEDIEAVSNGGGHFNFSHSTIHAGLGFFQLLEDVRKEIGNGLRPIIHFDMHGSRERGLEIGASGEFIDWLTLVEALRVLNVELENELLVVITACHGLHAILPVSFELPAPFLCLVAPEHEVTVGHIEDRVPAFYRVLFETQSLDQACFELGQEFTYFHSVNILVISLARYVRQHCRGRGARIRREALLTEIMNKGMPNTRQNRRAFRKKIRRHLDPTQELVNRYVGRFLMGKAPEIRMVDILKEVENSYA